MSQNKIQHTSVQETVIRRLQRSNRVLRVGLIGFAAFAAVSAGYAIGAAKQARRSADLCQAQSANLFRALVANGTLETKNQALRAYAEEAHAFALSIRPWLDENDSGCEKPNCAACQKMDAENAQKINDFNKACDTANIDMNRLNRLQKGFELE